MATNVTVAGVSYAFPQTGDSTWGDVVTAWAIAVSSKMLQTSGGNFTLTAEADFGATWGLKSAYFKSRGTNPATTGVGRLANTEGLYWRNAANSANLGLTVGADDLLKYNGNTLLTTTGTLTANRAVKTDVTGALTSSGVTDTEQGYLSGVTSAIQTQLNGKEPSITALPPDKGGSGVSNNAACTTTRSGNFGLTITLTGTTSIIFPTTGTLATLAGSETLASKTLTSPTINTPTINGQKLAKAAKTGAYTVASTDSVLTGDSSGAAFTFTLPAATGNSGQVFSFKKTDTSLNAITITDGTFSTTLATSGEAVLLQSDGSTYQVLNRYIPTTPTSFTPTLSAGYGTTSNNHAWWRRDGSFIELWGTFTTGTVAASVARIGLPSSLSADTSTIDRTSGQAVGIVSCTNSSSTGVPNIGLLFVATGQTQNLSVGNIAGGAATQNLAEINVSAVFNTSTAVSYYARLPISGWNG